MPRLYLLKCTSCLPIPSHVSPPSSRLPSPAQQKGKMTSGWSSAANVQGLARKLGPRGQAHLMPAANDADPSPPASRTASRVPSYAWMETVRRAANSFTDPRPSSRQGSTTAAMDSKTFHSLMPSILQDDVAGTSRSRGVSHSGVMVSTRPDQRQHIAESHQHVHPHVREFYRSHDPNSRDDRFDEEEEDGLSSRNAPDPANRLRANAPASHKPSIRFSSTS